MAYLGNLSGPIELHTVETLGREYFAITVAERQHDIGMFRETEGRRYGGKVRSVHVDKDGRRDVKFSTPRGEDGRCHLDDHRYF